MKGVTSPYYNRDRMAARVRRGDHRAVVGGLWNELGALQHDFLIAEGLRPSDRVIDIGCGSLRAGVRLVPFLHPGHYFGIELLPELLDAGYEREIVPAGLAGRLPRANLVATGDFDLSAFPVVFQYGIAQSVFTHLPLGFLGRCLRAVADRFTSTGRLYVTFFQAPEILPASAEFRPENGPLTHPDRDPYHHKLSAIAREVAPIEKWSMSLIGEWGHPRGQRMLKFTRR